MTGKPQFGKKDPALARAVWDHMTLANPPLVVLFHPQQAKLVTELCRIKGVRIASLEDIDRLVDMRPLRPKEQEA